MSSGDRLLAESFHEVRSGDLLGSFTALMARQLEYRKTVGTVQVHQAKYLLEWFIQRGFYDHVNVCERDQSRARGALDPVVYKGHNFFHGCNGDRNAQNRKCVHTSLSSVTDKFFSRPAESETVSAERLLLGPHEIQKKNEVLKVTRRSLKRLRASN